MQRVINAITTNIANGTKPNVSNTCQIESRRLFHGRGQCFDGLGFINVDWYHPVVLITLYQAVAPALWDEFLSGLESNKEWMQIRGIDCVLVQQRYTRGAPIEIVWGQIPEHVYVYESGMKFSLSLTNKQNIGFFLDMSPGRQWLRDNAENKRVLNLFSYTCSLSVAAIMGDAHSVVNVDMSKASLSTGRLNHQLNGHQERLKRDIHFMPYDIFRSWKAITKKGPYDIIVVDPPSRQQGSFIATKDYARVARRFESLMSDSGGDLLVCLNAPEIGEHFLVDMMREHSPRAKHVKRLNNREDFPEIDDQRNVKMMHYQFT